MEIILTIWGIGILYCIYDAIFLTELDSESKKELKNREKIIKDEHKSTS